MAKLAWAIACQKLITDNQTNSVSYIEAVEGFKLPQLPFPCPPFYVGTLWELEKEGEVVFSRVAIFDADGKEISAVEPKVEAKENSRRHRINIFFAGLVLKKTGPLKVVINQRKSGKWKRESSFQIDVGMIEQKHQ